MFAGHHASQPGIRQLVGVAINNQNVIGFRDFRGKAPLELPRSLETQMARKGVATRLVAAVLP
jgi:hypothetical protein